MWRKKESDKRKTEGVVWIISLCLGLCGAFLAGAPSLKEQQLQKEISQEVIRFHVLANSDSPEDQAEKLRVKETVVKKLQPVLAKASSREETKKLVAEQMEEIQEEAFSLVTPRKVRVSLETDWFPEKTYGDCTFPPGEYEALRIEIGEAKGHNWWCVLYPGLCFKEAASCVVPLESKEKLEVLLDEEAYDFILHPKKVKIRFRWLG